MHEMALVRDVVDVVLAKAQEARAKSVTEVYLTVGDARDIVVEYFQGLFRHLARGTIAENAEMVISSSPFMVECNQCGHVYHIDVRESRTWPCPVCGLKDYHVCSGMEFTIDGIEIEMDECATGKDNLNYETAAQVRERKLALPASAA